MRPEDLDSRDPVTRFIDVANDLLDQRAPDPGMVSRLIDVLESLQPRELVRFDEQARADFSGVRWSKVPGLRSGDEPDGARRGVKDRFLPRGARGSTPPDSSRELWGVLALVSRDGYERERAVRVALLRPVIVRLLVLRGIDWVPEVRTAALDRLDDCPPRLLVDGLSLAEQLATERARGEILSSFLDVRFSTEDLRHAYRAADPRTRRAAWRRLRARGVATPSELTDVAARDEDVVVRGIATSALEDMPVDARRNLAEILVDDRVGSVATPALAALVRLDGTPSILAGLAGRSAAVRRAARDWASIRGVDARGFYLRRLASDPNDAIALTGLAELGNEPDEELFRSMLEDPRTRIRAAGLRGLARVDGIAARRAALQALTGALTGRITRTAANILRDGTLTAEEITAISRIALDHTRAASQRFRSLSLLRAAPWPHLSVLLEARAMTKDGKARRQLDVELRYWLASSGRISRGPDPALRERIERQLPNIEDRARQRIEFVLRTSA